MKIQHWYDVECSICGRHLRDFSSDMQCSRYLAIQHAEAQGWIYDKDTDQNICPICQCENG